MFSFWTLIQVLILKFYFELILLQIFLINFNFIFECNTI